MKSLSQLSLACVIILGVSLVVYAQNDWAGTYEFYEDGGKTAGGTPIFISHLLDIVETEDGLVAMVQSNGYQTARDLVGPAKVEGSKLLVYFENYGENNTFQTFQKGDLLFTLERKAEKGKTVILTAWVKFLPVVPKNEKSGKTYFVKTGDEPVSPDGSSI